MVPNFLAELPDRGQLYVREIEERIGSEVVVRPVELADGVPLRGFPAYAVTERLGGRFVGQVLLGQGEIPSHVLFHEVLHLHRYLVQAVPQLKPRAPASDRKVVFVGTLEDDLEHLWIVPLELEKFPGAFGYWSDLYAGTTASQIAQVALLPGLAKHDAQMLRGNLLRAWLFTSTVLPGWPASAALWDALGVGGWQTDASNLVKKFGRLSDNKAQCAAMLLRFLGLPGDAHQLEIFDTAKGTVWRDELPRPV